MTIISSCRLIFPKTKSILCGTFPRLQCTVSTASLSLKEFKTHLLTSAITPETVCSRDDALNYISTMQRIRWLENAATKMYEENHTGTYCHLYTGQEAVAVGVEAALKPGDAIITSYRCHAYALTHGAPVREILAELAGKDTGSSRGLGGSMHIYHKDFFGGNGIVGAQVPVGVGVAMRMRNRGDSNISIALYGDGASNQGQVYESFNMAKLWNLPVVFICENNTYGMNTASHRASAVPTYYTQCGYIPGIWVDGMDVLSVREAMRFARNWCTSGKGPIILEAETYLFVGHSVADSGTEFRACEEVDAARLNRDPITLFRKRITEAQLVTEEEIQASDKQIEKEVYDDIKRCLNDSSPDPMDGIFSPCDQIDPDSRIRGCDPLTYFKVIRST